MHLLGNTMDYIIGVDLGGTQLRAILADTAGNILHEERVLTEAAQGPAMVIERIIACIEHVRNVVPTPGNLLGVGIGSPGPLDPDAGVIFTAPNMPGWHNVPLRDIITQRTGMWVELGNDANIAALAEWKFGAGQGLNNVVYITVSTGIGGGVISDGRLLLGRLGAAAELGHIILNVEGRQSWEDLASGTGLATAAAAAMAHEPNSLLQHLATPQTVTAAHVSQAYAQGDPLAQRLMQREIELLGLGFVSTLHLFSPDIILVGGSVATQNQFLIERARQVVLERTISDVYHTVPIQLTALGDQVGVLGAVALLLYKHALRT